ncbi:hypothetical protein [Streptomyces seoulensis]|uniref:hypothetical protein n=1 Tax=Streptomyces seoulensis TaxID=73044 RepID=UPI001FCAAB25|nr:hypothetical protein [Streptomyces seoulensis]BDH07433.1 hypothetical protein HEK131_46600 [Streptomyces seoulensis]
MSRHILLALGAALAVLACAGCGVETKPYGEAALKDACEGVLDTKMIAEARKSDNFGDLHVADGTRSHASAVKTMLEEDHAAYACIVDDKSSSKSDSGALSIKFIPGLGPLFSPDETQSYGGYRSSKLGNGMQAIIEPESASVNFQCASKDWMRPLSVTGKFYSDFPLSSRARFQPLFQSSLKVAKILKCQNAIQFPDPAEMKYLPPKKK